MRIDLNSIDVLKNTITYNYTADTEAEIFFDKSHKFFIEYQTEIDFTNVPDSVLAIPFVTNLLPLCLIYDVTLTVNDIDKDFYKSIDDIKKGFVKVYPEVELKGEFIAKNIVNNAYEVSDKTTCLFSGGVDATFTFLRHRKEKPVLFNVWGVDISLDDVQGHDETQQYFIKLAKAFDTSYICIKSTLRKFLNESYLNTKTYEIIKDYWWHGAQHSIGLLSLLAPYNYINKIKTNYIASTFTQTELDQGVKCASYPIIDNALVMASTKVVHDGFDYARIDKIKYICSTCKEENYTVDLKVCFHYINGKNCSACEKCFRTIAAILVYDTDVEKYGFKLKKPNAPELRRFLDTHEIGLFRWIPIQNAYTYRR